MSIFSYPVQIVTLLPKKAQFMSVVTWLFWEKQNSAKAPMSVWQTHKQTILFKEIPHHKFCNLALKLFLTWTAEIENWIVEQFTNSHTNVRVHSCHAEAPREHAKAIPMQEWATFDAATHKWQHQDRGGGTRTQLLNVINVPLRLRSTHCCSHGGC